MRIAFYAPMKPPDHAVPSGDRRMARALIGLLEAAGHDVTVASRLRAFDGSGDAARQGRIRARATREVARVIARLRPRPHAWFTYHVHHKAPDWIGPAIADRLGIPYIVAEPSVAWKRDGGPWAIGFAGALAAIRRADAVLTMTEVDRQGLRGVVPARRIVRLPPFLDPAPFEAARRDRAGLAARHGLDADVPWLLTVAMMRPGDKLASYVRLGAALTRLRRMPWQLIVIGAGPAEADCRAALARLGNRVRLLGALPPPALPAYYAAADVFVWPGVGEAYGMAYLEAQAAGLPVVAGAEPGVGAVVRDGRSGFLVPPGDAAAFAAAIARLIEDADLRATLGRRARAYVGRGHAPATALRAVARALRIAGAAP
jgi:glycosyltransferase involved in cell wall biosynthesis